MRGSGAFRFFAIGEETAPIESVVVFYLLGWDTLGIKQHRLCKGEVVIRLATAARFWISDVTYEAKMRTTSVELGTYCLRIEL